MAGALDDALTLPCSKQPYTTPGSDAVMHPYTMHTVLPGARLTLPRRIPFHPQQPQGGALTAKMFSLNSCRANSNAQSYGPARKQIRHAQGTSGRRTATADHFGSLHPNPAVVAAGLSERIRPALQCLCLCVMTVSGGDVRHLKACSFHIWVLRLYRHLCHPEQRLLHQLNSSVFGIITWLSPLAALVAVSNGFTS